MSQNLLDNGLTIEEENCLIALLAKINPKMMGTRLFDAIARKTVSVAIEAVCLRMFHDGIRVYLIERSLNDTAYCGQWHCPGSVMRSGEDVKDVFERLVKREFGSSINSWKFVANVNHTDEERGHFFSLVYLCDLDLELERRGKWFSINNLPDNIVLFHKEKVIPIAVGAFLEEN